MRIHFSHVLGIEWISASLKPINLKCLCFPCFFPYNGNYFSHVLGTAWISASYKKFKKPLTLKCLHFPIFSLTMGIHFSHILGILWISDYLMDFLITGHMKFCCSGDLILIILFCKLQQRCLDLYF